MKIAIASDHAGLRLKRQIIGQFPDIEFVDVGTHTEESCDYPDYAAEAARLVASGKAARGIVICGSGIGVSIAANKIRGIRAALCFNCYMAEMSRKHNDANVLALGARVIGEDVAMRIVDTWLKTEFEGGRHKRRVDKMMDLENR